MQVGEAAVVETEQIEDGGVDVAEGDGFALGADAELVGRSGGGTGLDIAPGHPHGEAVLIVVATGLVGLEVVDEGRASHFGCPDDEGLLEQAAGFEVFEEAADGLVDFGGVLRDALFDVAVIVPTVASDFDAVNEEGIAHARLEETAGEQALAAEAFGAGIVEAVERRVTSDSLERSTILGASDCMRKASS